jgi:UDP-N-acetylmuramoyl-L-alanyl-D-glutamate--2,6-diaminopimelate ligase
MNLGKLLNKMNIECDFIDHNVSKIVDSSKEPIKDSICFCINGYSNDGHLFIDEAIGNGCRTIFLEKKVNEYVGINYIYVENAKKVLATCLHYYNYHKTKNIKIIGVTGTTGKTSTSHNIYNMLNHFNHKCALIGSSGFKYNNYHKSHANTTPNICVLYEYIDYCYRKRIKYIVMEISSIAVSELRCHRLDYYAIIFTNMSEDHLDYHKSIENYLFNKLIPIYTLSTKSHLIINKDDFYYKEVIKHTKCKVHTFSINAKSNYKALNPKFNENEICFIVNNIIYRQKVLGLFNIYNLLPLFFFKDILNINEEDFKEFIYNLGPVDGRMNVIKFLNRNVIIDYAHTEYAVKTVLESLIGITKGNTYVLFGCGGNRQKDKREKIGRLVSKYNVNIILTSDNPRNEDPMDIIDEIKKGITKECVVIEDRKDALIYALDKLQEDDYLLILGKGIENYIEINDKRIEYSDFKVVNEYISRI